MCSKDQLEAALALGLDATTEAEQGLTLASGWALLQRRYSHIHDYEAGILPCFRSTPTPMRAR